ncbi:unnamed protein product [Brachionus calyciflorus]|uniref:Uncharacterized protein n=1 Tax=Brachionus calyciflorus TaxID=104777 RepID=A0A813M8I4_9BILA|nr:unnamed protein product [Brachionus calyciflorus]
MVSSVTNKELNHEWENERYKDYQESMRNLSSSSKTENLVVPKSDKKASKQEIYLPKTRLSRTGQLLLFTSEDEKDLYETRINSILAKNSKKWIDDADKELNSEASKFLDERLDENLNAFLNNRNSRITKIMGKNSKYLIQDLKIKSGKDRRLQRASYLEYLPSDFDPKNELADALKSLNPLNNNTNTEVQFSSRQNKHSSFSIAEISDCISTDDEKDDKQFRLNTSRLSSHPVLSTQNLIKRLSSTANVSHLLRDKPNELNVESIQKSSSPGTKHSENELVVNYKETFQFDFIDENNNINEIDKNNHQSKETSNEKKTLKIEPQKNILSSKKILDKRYFIRVQNTSPVDNSRPENSETITLKQPPRSARNNSLLNVKNNTNRQALYSGNRKKDVSSNNDDSNNLNNLAVLGYKKLDNDDNISTLLTRNQNSFYSSFANNYTPSTPMPSHDKILSSGPTYKPAVYFKPALDDENIEPITISVTEIENENTGNSVRIRRFFDRQSIRINKISLNTETKPSLYTRLQKSLSANSVRNKQIKNSEIEEPHVDNFAIKLNPKIVKKDEKNRIKSAPIEQSKIIDISNISSVNKIGSNNNSVKSSRKQSIVSIKNELVKNIDNDIPDSISKNYESLGHTTDRIDDVNDVPNGILDISKEEKQAGDIDLENKDQVENLQQNDWSVENSPNSDSDKNVQSVDYVDNLSISSRISPSRKDSTYLNDFIDENYEEKIETESEAYEKLDRMKNKAENSHSDYQEIINLESQVPKDEQNENITEDDNKIETILEENVKVSHIDLDEEKYQDQFFEEIPEIEEALYVEPEDEKNIFENENENFDENKTVESQDYTKNNYVETQTVDNNEKESDRDDFVSNQNENDVQNTLEVSDQENNLTKDNIEENYLNDEMSQINLEKQVKIESPFSNVEEESRPFSSDIEAKSEVKDIKIDEFKEESLKSEDGLNQPNLINQDSFELNLKNNSVKSFETTKTESIHERPESEKSLQSYDEANSIQPKNTEERKISISIVLNQPEFIDESKSTFSNQRETEDNLEKNEPEIVVLDTNKNEDLIKKENESINNLHDANLNNFSLKKEIIDEKADLFVKPEQNLKDSNTSLTIEPLVEIKKTDLKLEKNSSNENELNKLINNNEKQGKKVEFSDHVMEKIISKVDESISETKKKEETLAIPKIQMVDSIESNIKPTEELKKESVIVHPPSQKPPLNRPTARTTTTTAVKQTVKNPKSNPESHVKSEDVLKIQPIETSAPQVEKKLDLSRFDDLLGIKHDESKHENDEEEKRFKKPVKESKFDKKMREKKERFKNFPYLQLPWDSREAIVDEPAYREAFSVPDVLSPLIHKIDPTSTSVDELILERRILEDKILELRNEKLNIVNMTDDQRAKLKNKNDKKKKIKKQELTKINKEIDLKEKVIREERIRLQHEAFKRQTERDNVGKLLEESIEEKVKEIDNLNKELENNQKELNSQLSSIMQQINYLEGTEDEIRDALSQARNELRDRIKKNHQATRKAMKEMHEDRRESKLFDFNVKQKELEWLIGMYTDSPDETNKIKAKQSALEAEIEQWLFKFENDCIDQEKEIDDKEAEEENLIVSMEQEEEDNALKSIKQEQFELLQEKKNLIENFEEIKNKIIQRIEKISEEKLIMEGEKEKFDQNIQMDIEKQKQKLVEILEAEKQAKEEIKKELENYKQALFLRRDKNLALKSNLSFLNHSQQITKPYVFSYVMHWPIELFGRPFDQDKMKKSKPKK